MSTSLKAIEEDNLALSVGFALAVADKEAVARGLSIGDVMVTICEEAPPPARVWRVHDGPRQTVNRRGGDLLVFVGEKAGEVVRVLKGQ